MAMGFIQDPRTGERATVPLDKLEGVLVRRDFGPDVSVLKEYRVTYSRMIDACAGHRFLDVGAHIGMFTVNAMAHGATGGTCYEPEPGSASVLRENVKQYGRKVKVIQQAIGAKNGETVLYVPRSGNSVSASTVWASKLRGQHPVKQRAFLEAIEESRATLVKLDCEGAELQFLDAKKLPSSVKVVCGELHREKDNEARCQRIIKSFSKWEPIHMPSSYSYARCWIVAWRRP
jgi:FkbM family methyltransferase